MRNIYLVVKQEIRSTLGKRSFWIMTFVFPLFIMLLNVGTQVITRRTIEQSEAVIPVAGQVSEQQPALSLGYVDEAGLIKQFPKTLPAGTIERFSNEEDARAALETGRLERYALIPANYLETGEIVVVDRTFRPLAATPNDLLQYVIAFNLTGSEGLAAAATKPLADVRSQALAPTAAADAGSPAATYLPVVTLFLFFLLITMSSGLMLQSVSREKENRTMEVLLLSVRPRELMLGKVLGLSVVALLQMVIWMGGGMLVLTQGQSLLADFGQVSLPAGFIMWAVPFFLLGFLLYASVMGAIGALAADVRTGSQFTFFALVPLMIPAWLNSTFQTAPDGSVATILSLFPLTAPTSMITRMVSTSVPVWQPALSLLGLAITTYGIVVHSARCFRADTLLSGSQITWQRIKAEVTRDE